MQSTSQRPREHDPVTPVVLRHAASTGTPQRADHATPRSASSANGSYNRMPPPNSYSGASPARRRTRFEEYVDFVGLQKGLKRGTLFRSKIRLNAQNPREAYCSVDGIPVDVLVQNDNQNRCIEGDEVALQLLPLNYWYVVKKACGGGSDAANGGTNGEVDTGAIKQRMLEQARSACGAGADVSAVLEPWLHTSSPDAALRAVVACVKPELRPTGKVVHILEKSFKRDNVVGVLREQGAGLALHPLDPKMPRGFVAGRNAQELSATLKAEARDPNCTARTLVSARICDWPPDAPLPAVVVRHRLGQAGELDTGTAAILAAEGIRDVEFPPEVLECLPATPWAVGERELEGRFDMRFVRVFSIDPPTARDLDDALSIEPLPNGNCRLGVHIADVSHFVHPDSPLDREAQQRGTSVYLVQKVIPMLPRLLCEQLCSLNPGEDRLAFSVIWEMTPEGHILDQWVGKTVINTCAKLAYPQVQQMLEHSFDAAACTTPLHNGHTWDAVIADCLALHRFAVQLRARRFENGALRLDNTKLTFTLDGDGNPVESGPYIQQEANQLIEEYMLLANMSVAKIISDAFPDRAVLRRHPPPNDRKMDELQEVADNVGLQLDVSTAGSLHRTLAELRARCADDPSLAEVVTMMATRPMQLAQYFSTGSLKNDAWRHYALAVDHYTHFTSPIRRYPDILVHRLLQAAIEMQQLQDNGGTVVNPAALADAHRLPKSRTLMKITSHCNATKLSARLVQDASVKLYMCVMLRRRPTITDALVTQVSGDKFFQVYLPEFGCEQRLVLDQMGLPLVGAWDLGAKTLSIRLASPEEQAVQAAAAASSTVTNATDFDTRAWVASLRQLHNPHGLQPLPLPAAITIFAHVPVILGAYLSSHTGHTMGVAAKLYLQELPTQATAPPAPAQTQSSVLRYDNLDD